MKIKKIILSALLLFAFSANSVFASVLGDYYVKSWGMDIGHSVSLFGNTIHSAQQDVGLQTEFYSVYMPNEKVIPVVMSGDKIAGLSTANQIATYMKNNDIMPVMGINASFFSFETGVPTGHVITNGVLTANDMRTLPGVGFNKDGSAFIADLGIKTYCTFGENQSIQIPHINKYITKNVEVTTLYTPEYGEYTGIGTETLNIVLGNISDKVRIGKSFTATVENIFTSSEKVKIEKDKYIISANSHGNMNAIEILNKIQVGDTLTISTTANEDRWNYAYNGLASDGERLLKNGSVPSGLAAGAAPRTAVGVKESGAVVFYALDGRQPGYSYGAKKETLAKRLKELGCVDAINLDGGGSTTIFTVYPGDESTTVINSPSENSQRAVTNFIVLQNMEPKIGDATKLFFYPYSKYVLSGTTVDYSLKATDDNYYACSLPENIEVSTDSDSKIIDNTKVKLIGDGDITLNANAINATGSVTYKAYKTPDSIRVFDRKTSKELNMTDVLPDDTFSFYYVAYKNGMVLDADQECFDVSISDNSKVQFDKSNGTIKILKGFCDDTYLKVKAGDKEVSYKICLGSRANGDYMYPKTEISVDNNLITVTMDSEIEEIDFENSYIKIDGIIIPFENCEKEQIDNKSVFQYDNKDNFSKIYVKTTSKSGYTTIKTYSNKEYLIDNVFSDTNIHWAKNIISYMNMAGIANGSVLNGKLVFNPNNNITREEFAVLIAKYLDYNPNDYKNLNIDGFNDKNAISSWAVDYVKAVYKNGIVNGKTINGKLYFNPKDNITREETFAIISRILPEKLQEKNLSFSDKNAISSWALTSVKRLVSNGLVSGYSDNTIKPKNNISRSEAISMIYNIY